MFLHRLFIPLLWKNDVTLHVEKNIERKSICCFVKVKEAIESNQFFLPSLQYCQSHTFTLRSCIVSPNFPLVCRHQFWWVCGHVQATVPAVSGRRVRGRGWDSHSHLTTQVPHQQGTPPSRSPSTIYTIMSICYIV